ncbi:hypothetical protein U5A82_11870 [Sphingobium sp. CR2-8]|nr:hypothetical protein [Sphingobium sp. CR2-8]MEC3911139.1 hypothetical protein [Sphingobium sp. CR2-8]
MRTNIGSGTQARHWSFRSRQTNTGLDIHPALNRTLGRIYRAGGGFKF